MAKNRKRCGWAREGVKVREKRKGSGVWWVFINHDGKRKSFCKGARDAADAFANEMRARFELVEARKHGLTIDELQRIGLAESAAPTDYSASVTFSAFAARFLERNQPDERPPVAFTLSRYVSRPANDRARYANCIDVDVSAPECTQNAPAWKNDGADAVQGDGLRQSDSVLAEARAASSAG